MPAAVDRISIDVTETVMKREWTGIGRVIRRLADELRAGAALGGPPLRLVAAIDGRFHELNELGQAQLMVRGAATTQAGHGKLTELAGKLLSAVPTFYLLMHSWAKQRAFNPVLRSLLKDEMAAFGPSDAILLLDTYWGGMSSIVAARRARARGATVVSTIYDMIPVTHPQYMPRLVTLAFPVQILRALRVSDGALAISRASAAELRRFLGQRVPSLTIRSFQLGNDNAEVPASPRSPTEDFAYAIIGTIEPRKSHDVVLDVFERRWAAGSTSRLTIIGKMGWGVPAIERRLNTHPELGRRLMVHHDVADAELAATLATVDAVIQASTVEGFGLPIVEALANDIPVIASDIPVFREIGGDAIGYFTSGSPDALVTAIDRFEADPAYWRERAQRFYWPSWQLSAAQVVEAVRAIATARHDT